LNVTDAQRLYSMYSIFLIAILLPQIGDESGKYVNPTFAVHESITLESECNRVLSSILFF
jgi:hypothetical protein